MLILIFFFFKQKTAYEMLRSLVGSEMCIRDRYQRRVRGDYLSSMVKAVLLVLALSMALAKESEVKREYAAARVAVLRAKRDVDERARRVQKAEAAVALNEAGSTDREAAAGARVVASVVEQQRADIEADRAHREAGRAQYRERVTLRQLVKAKRAAERAERSVARAESRGGPNSWQRNRH
eukprot:TRINITY_DN11055_c0_g1_i1.p1 TRINITY_DN11055_c0_g1~~TRINITY_DN11055_c0_g1_i1.p1  ORF type:complete len:181 (+),score=45.48 TRINITY_DN11055_c0_g1_i1:52-594(+)